MTVEGLVTHALPPYISFFPAIMASALLAGLGPGLLATTLSCLMTNLWVLNASGIIRLASPADRVGLAIFFSTGVFMSVIARIYQRVRSKAAAYDRQMALDAGERRMRQALRVSRSFTFDWDPRTDRVERSDSCASILSLIGDEAVTSTGQLYFQSIHLDDRDRFVQMLRNLTPTDAEYTTEYRVMRPDGTEVVLEEVGHAEFDTHGNLAQLYGVSTNITERKRAEVLEREAEALAFASRTAMEILESMGEGVLLLDMDGRIVSCNPALERMSGIPAGESVGRLIQELIPEILSPQDQHLASDALSIALSGQDPEIPPFTLLSRAGTHIYAMLSATFIRDMEGRPREVVVTLRDASELHHAQESLQTANALLERIFDNTHMSIVYLDREFNFIRVNRAYADACQCEPAFFTGKNHFTLYPNAENEAIFRQVVKSGNPVSISEKPFVFPGHPELGVTYWDWTLRPLRGDRNHVESLLFCLLDVTTRVHARQALAESERNFRELVENASSIIIRFSPEINITFFNEYAQTFFGYTEAEVLGKNVVGTIVPKVDTEGRNLRTMVRDFSAQPEAYGSNENENMCKDGRRVWVHWANKAIRDQDGNVTEFLSVGTDITERRRLQVQALRYQHRLRELAKRLASNEEQDRWRISRYIHNTIVQNLALAQIRLGSLEKLLVGTELTEAAQKIDSIRALLDEAIDQCRTAMSDLTPALLYELGLIPALNGFARKLEEQHGVPVTIEDDGQELSLPPELRGLLFESVRELIMNALKYAGPCEIRVFSSCRAAMLEIRVTDNGKGFDPSSEVPATGSHGGFGTFSIRQRIEGLGGELDIASAPGKGTIATIRLPVES